MLKLGRFAQLLHHFATRDKQVVAGISGGETSGLMDALLDEHALRAFQNTGEESNRTYDFIDELAAATGHPITWLEYRSPPYVGAPPCEATFAIVDSKTADRSGGPFDAFMHDLNAYRAAKGVGPIAPWHGLRICTAYMKGKTQDRWVKSLGLRKRCEFSGLRADEPDRVLRWESRTTRNVDRQAPLSRAGVAKADVKEFWSWQPFRLGIEEFEGNCGACFEKDESDQARALYYMSHEAAHRWILRQKIWPGFGGNRHVGYERLLNEAPARLEIEQALRAGDAPQNTHGLDDRRHRLVVIQERKRLKGQLAPFSCSCEGSETLVGLTDDEENQLVLDLPAMEAA